jgi:diadenosine tetraphosphate (Ap4A) HIT family hydrolase
VDKVPMDVAAYVRRVRTADRCFICAIVAGEPGFDHEVVFYDDGEHIAFLSRYPTVYGYALVAPREQQGNRHQHWHIVALPPGTPYEEQQLEAMRISNGILDWSVERAEELGSRLTDALAGEFGA